MKLNLFVVVLLLVTACQTKTKTEVPVAKAEKGVFQIEITEEGEIQATNSINISSPNLSWRYGSLKITNIIDDGKQVQAGDTVVVFDPSEVKKAIVESESRLEIDKAELEKMRAQHKSQLEELQADLDVTRIDKEISKIKFKNSSYLSEIERKKIKLNLDKAEIELEKAIEQIDNRKKIQREEIQQKKLSIGQSESELDDARETLNKLYLVSKSPGIAIITENWSTGNKFQVGDQCWSGFPLLQLPDLTELKAIVKINEVDVSKIKEGLRVEIKPDAFSKQEFAGKIKTVANLAVNKERNSKIKVFPVEIIIEGEKGDLMPGLTVSCKIIVEEIEDVLYIPVDALYSELGQDYVYIKSGSGFKRRDIKTSLSNNDFVVIEKGLNKGDEVALIYPFEEEEKNSNESSN